MTEKISDGYRRQAMALIRRQERLKAEGKPYAQLDPAIAALQDCQLRSIRDERAAEGKTIHGQGSLDV
jgi:hypothetical protein